MLTMLLYFLMALRAFQTPSINALPVAQNCTSVATCTYVDNNVAPGVHFYFAEATNGQNSIPSNSAVVTIPSDGQSHHVTLSWNPSPTSNVGYLIFRGAPATGVVIVNSH